MKAQQSAIFAVALAMAMAVIAGAAEDGPAALQAASEMDCPMICPALYAPMCGVSGKTAQTFNNPCAMKMENCKQARLGLERFTERDMAWCRATYIDNLPKALGVDLTKTGCLRPCTMIYEPYCVGSDKYRTAVGNRCQLETLNCVLKFVDANTDLMRILKSGEC